MVAVLLNKAKRQHSVRVLRVRAHQLIAGSVVRQQQKTSATKTKQQKRVFKDDSNTLKVQKNPIYSDKAQHANIGSLSSY